MNWWLSYSFQREVGEHEVPAGTLIANVDRVSATYVKGERVCLFGSSIAREKTIAAASEIVNLHLGYLPHFRGCKPEVWARALGGKQGVTLHRVTTDIDGGEILYRHSYFGWMSGPISYHKAQLLFWAGDIIKHWEFGDLLGSPLPNVGGKYYSTPPAHIIWKARK